jgi:hypothetical protein
LAGLCGRAGYGTVTTEYAAIPCLGLEQGVAMRAFIKKLTTLGRHIFLLALATLGTGDGSRGLDSHLLLFLSSQN